MRFELLLRPYKILFARFFLADQISVATEGVNCLRDRQMILQHITDQVCRKLSEKRSWKKPMKGALQKGLNGLSCLLSPSHYPQPSEDSGPNLDLGKDEFGRDVGTNVRAYVHLLRSRGVKLHTVLVLGSRAKARWSSRSDVDLVIIADDLPDPAYERWFYVRDNPINMGADLFACSKVQFIRYLEEFRILPLDAVCFGIVVFDDGFWLEIKARFEELEKEYRLERSQLHRMLTAV